jgi:hypothetical protein
MKLSGHSFSNETFGSLLDGLCKDVTLNKQAQTVPVPEVNNFFSSVTAQTLATIQRDELDSITEELNFAAERAKVAITIEDLAKFASVVKQDKLRGKMLERAARTYCNQLNRETAAPVGIQKLNPEDLINQLSASKIMPAGYNSESVNDSITGKYMGSMKNPNSIWNSEALTAQAQIALGDEQIKASKTAQKEYRDQMKTAQVQTKVPDQPILGKVLSSGSLPATNNFNPKTPSNAMSIFSNNRDFENIPEKTIGEEIIASAKERANKRAQVEPQSGNGCVNTKTSLDKFFKG